MQTLKAEIEADQAAIAELYARLDRYGVPPASEEQCIAVAYYLHNIYSAFESIFQRIARAFGNHLDERAGWYTELLHRMTLTIEGIRPRIISGAAYDALDELRRFRHLFRSAYTLNLDAARLALVQTKARTLQASYQAELAAFLAFLDTLQHE